MNNSQTILARNGARNKIRNACYRELNSLQI